MSAQAEASAAVDLWEALRGLSLALDPVMGRHPGHAQATAHLALGVGQRLGLSAEALGGIAMTALLKDAGCAASRPAFTAAVGLDDIAFHRHVFGMDRFTPATFAALLWNLQRHWADRATARVKGWTHALLGLSNYRRQFARRNAEAARLAEQLRCPVGAVAALGAVGEHWDGSGNPGRQSGQAIPLAARIVLAAQLATIWGEALGPTEVATRLGAQSGNRLDPQVVGVLRGVLSAQTATAPIAWLDALTTELARQPSPLPPLQALTAPLLAAAFAEIVDAKSTFTAQHSQRVAALSGAVARLSDASGPQIEAVLLAGLLHDLGKLAVPNLVLDKEGALTSAEWDIVRRHPADSQRVLAQIPGWESVAVWAGAHHERPDGRGYHVGQRGAEIPLVGRWIAVADAFDAMTTDRPYRPGLDPAEALRRLAAGRGTQFDPQAVALLHDVVADGTPLVQPARSDRSRDLPSSVEATSPAAVVDGKDSAFAAPSFDGVALRLA